MSYRINDEVEIYGEDDGFEQTYFEATIVSRVRAGLYRVQYVHLLTEDGRRPLVEQIWENRIRPRPYTVDVPEFHVGDVVDARFNDGWWIGTVQLIDYQGYEVSFTHFPGEYKYQFNELRLHQTKIGRTWVYNRQQMQYEADEDVEITLPQGEEQHFIWEGRIVNRINGGMYSVEFKHNWNEDGSPYEDDIHVSRIRPVPYAIDIDHFVRGDIVDVFREGMWYKGVVSGINGNQYRVRLDAINLEMFYGFGVLRIHQHRSVIGDWNYVKY